MEAAAPFVLALALGAVHVFAGKLRFLEGLPRSIWLSSAGGVSVAYIFVHVLPELSERQEAFVGEGTADWFAYLEHHVYLIALFGLVVFYGLERAACASRKEPEGGADTTSPGVFRLHLVSFSFYNAVVGYLLVYREAASWEELLFYFVAMALHFVVTDFGLREHHRHRYAQVGRWVLAAAVLAGWGVALVTEVDAPFLATLFAFLAGGVVLNVLKEELPAERQSRFWAFLAGVVLYTVLLLLG